LRSVLEVLEVDSPTLLIAFSGKAKDPSRTFNFLRMTSDLPVKKLYVRDLNNSWYHGEHPGIGAGVDALAEWIRGVIREQDVRKVVTLGCSMGGYAAILLGALIDADRVLAITPQTFVDRRSRLLYGDTRSRALKNKILTYPSAAPQYFRLGRFLRNYPYQGRIEVHRGWDRLDYLHARQIASLPNVRMTLHETHRHDLAGVLKRRGFLYRLILETLDIGEHQAPIAQITERRRYARIRSRVKALVAT